MQKETGFKTFARLISVFNDFMKQVPPTTNLQVRKPRLRLVFCPGLLRQYVGIWESTLGGLSPETRLLAAKQAFPREPVPRLREFSVSSSFPGCLLPVPLPHLLQQVHLPLISSNSPSIPFPSCPHQLVHFLTLFSAFKKVISLSLFPFSLSLIFSLTSPNCSSSSCFLPYFSPASLLLGGNVATTLWQRRKSCGGRLKGTPEATGVSRMQDESIRTGGHPFIQCLLTGHW
jgi:hypothetical protein